MKPEHPFHFGSLILAASLPVCLWAGGASHEDRRPTEGSAFAAVAASPAGGVSFRIGDRISEDKLHPVTRPGLYGIGRVPSGSSYGVSEGRLIRYDPETMQIQSVIRRVDGILD